MCAAPHLGPPWPGVPEDLGVRRLLLPRFPFAIAYLVRDDDVVVLAMAHTRRKPAYWIRRVGG
jgi:hypothetical protein